MEWVVVPKFEKYSVNNLGQVRHNRTDRLVAPQMNQFGVPYVGMMSDKGTHHNRSLAKLVADNFVPKPYPLFDTPITLDWDRWNCNALNLMWRPRWFAIRYHQQAQNPYENHIERPVRPIDSEEVYQSTQEASKAYGLLERDLVLSILGRTYVWPTYQMFEFADDVTY